MQIGIDNISGEREVKAPVQKDMVKSPEHYVGVLGEELGIEVIDIANALNLNGNRFSILKYLLRAGLKDASKEVEDLEKIIQYANFEVRRLKGEFVSDTRRKRASLDALNIQNPMHPSNK